MAKVKGSSKGKGGDASGSKDALAALEAHFANTFDVPSLPVTRQRKEKVSRKGKEREEDVRVEAGSNGSQGLDIGRKAGKAVLKAQPPQRAAPETVIFGETSGGASGSTRGAGGTSGWRRFMSSKVTTKADEERLAEAAKESAKKGAKTKSGEGGEGGEEEEEEEEEEAAADEKQAQSNDRALSELLSTTLFAPGTSSKRSNGRPNLGSNDTLARLMELSQPSMTGKAQSQGRGYGEAMLKSKDMSKMPATIRHGMRRVEVENQERELQRQKELGNYHHSIKGLIGKRDGLDLVLGTKDKDRKKRTRDKGLGMGVGNFTGGTLRLSEREVQKINHAGSSGSKKRRTK